jgi:AraC-like DNA-binding protein
VSDLAGEAGMSVEHFIRRFRHRFGMSPSACRTRAKLAEAARLLRGGDRSVKSVAYSLGFQDPDAFARLFKRHIGIAPSRCLPRSDDDEPLGSTFARLVPEETMEGRFYPLNAHITPSDNDHPRAFDELTDWVAHTHRPRSAEDFIYRRKARGSPRK